MRKLIFTMVLTLLLCNCVDAATNATKIGMDRLNWAQPLPIGENITLNGGFVIGMSTDQYVIPDTFGAVGDDVTDDTIALQNCIDYANANSLVVLIPQKTYAFSSELHVPGGAVIRGLSDRRKTPSESRLHYTGSGVALNLSNSSGSDVYVITLEDFSLVGNGTVPAGGVGTGILIVQGSEFKFRDMEISLFETGIYGDVFTISELNGIAFAHNEVGIFLTGSSQINIYNCNLFDHNTAIQFETASDINILYNYFEVFNTALLVDGTDAPADWRVSRVTGNRFHNPLAYFTAPLPTDIRIPWNGHVLEVIDGESSYNTKCFSVSFTGNSFMVYKTDELIYFDANGNIDSFMNIELNQNYCGYANTSIVNVVAGAGGCHWVINDIPDNIPSTKVTGTGWISGYDKQWGYSQMLGTWTLPTPLSTTEGAIWYDNYEKKVKFYDGTSVQTMLSS